jgi:hypothetical protein
MLLEDSSINSHSSGNYDKLQDAWKFGEVLAIAVATLLLALEHDRFVKNLLSGTLESYLGWAVLAVSLFWLFDLRRATRNELTLFRDHHLLDRKGLVDWPAESTAYIVSIALGALVGAVPYPQIFCLLAVVIQIGDCVGVWMIQRAAIQVFQVSQGLDPILSEYYFCKPHFLHRVAKLVGFMTALLFSTLRQYSGRSKFGVISWIIVLITIIGGEGVLMHWRSWLKMKLSQ